MIDLAPLHSFSLPYHATDCQVFSSIDALREAAKDQALFEQSHIIVGEGTNTVFSSDFNGTVIRLVSDGLSMTEDKDHYYLSVDAGFEWHQLVSWAMDHKIWGLENLALIPGTAGAAPIQNIGAYGVEFAEVCDFVEYLDKDSLSIVRLDNHELQFGYRDSIFKRTLADKTVISTVGLKLKKAWQGVANYKGLEGLTRASQIYDAVIAQRQSKLPDHKAIPNAGSFFKNPIVEKALADRISNEHAELPSYEVDEHYCKIPAAWLIERCGLKGHTIGGVSIYKNHALILINSNNGTGDQLIELIDFIRATVNSRFGVNLEPEVRVIGPTGELEWEDCKNVRI